MILYCVGNMLVLEKGTVLFIMRLYYIWLLNCINQYGKCVFCTFIDCRKAFDSMDRSLLWQKLLSYNIIGKVKKNIIREIYSKAKSCIRKDNISDYFYVLLLFCHDQVRCQIIKSSLMSR